MVEIVVNGYFIEDVEKALKDVLKILTEESTVTKISAGNYGGKLGSKKIYMRNLFS